MTTPNIRNEFDFASWHDAVDLMRSVPWHVLRGLRGNPHDSLIGLLSRWWIERSGSNWALDGPPSNGRRRQADLILGSAETPRAVIEVEGTHHERKLETLEGYLTSTRSALAGLNTAILLSYAYPPERPDVPFVTLVERARLISENLPNRWMLLINVSKVQDDPDIPVMRVNDYYRYRFDRVMMTPMLGGSALLEPTELARVLSWD